MHTLLILCTYARKSFLLQAYGKVWDHSRESEWCEIDWKVVSIKKAYQIVYKHVLHPMYLKQN